MTENLSKQEPGRKKPEEIVNILAGKHKKTARYVRMVISGERSNDQIFSDYMTYSEEHNLLLKAVKELVSF
jgi:hypothetical protein